MQIDEATLIEYALETLPEGQRHGVARALEGDAGLRAQLASLTETLGGLDSGPLTPPDALRGQVVGSVSNRFGGFAHRLAELFEISQELASHYLETISLAPAEPWRQTRAPGVFALDVPEAATTGQLIYLQAGYNVPQHGHTGDEVMLVLDGYATESTGRDVAPGDLIFSDADKDHEFTIRDQAACIFAVSLTGDIDYRQ